MCVRVYDPAEACNALHLCIAVYASNPRQKLKDLQTAAASSQDMHGALDEVAVSQLPETDGVYLIARAGDTMYCAIRGSVITSDWCKNFSAVPVNAGGVNAHYGFWQRSKSIPFSALREHLHKQSSNRVVICGHSLGAAVATAATYEMLSGLHQEKAQRVQCIGFASPLVFSGATVKNINSYYRDRFVHFVDDRDVVVKVVMWVQQLLKSNFLKDKVDKMVSFLGLLGEGADAVNALRNISGLAVKYAFGQLKRAIDFHPVGHYVNVNVIRPSTEPSSNGQEPPSPFMTDEQVQTLLDYKEGDLTELAIADVLNFHDVVNLGRSLRGGRSGLIEFKSRYGCTPLPDQLTTLSIPTVSGVRYDRLVSEQVNIEVHGEHLWNVRELSLRGLNDFCGDLDRKLSAHDFQHIDTDRIAFTVPWRAQQPGTRLPETVEVEVGRLYDTETRAFHQVPLQTTKPLSANMMDDENTVGLLISVFTLLLLAEDDTTKLRLQDAKRLAGQILCRVPLRYFLHHNTTLLDASDDKKDSTASDVMVKWFAVAKRCIDAKAGFVNRCKFFCTNSGDGISASTKRHVADVSTALPKTWGLVEQQASSHEQQASSHALQLPDVKGAVYDDGDVLAPSLMSWFDVDTPEAVVDKLHNILFGRARGFRNMLRTAAVAPGATEESCDTTTELAMSHVEAMENIKQVVAVPVCRFLSPADYDATKNKITFQTGVIGQQIERLLDPRFWQLHRALRYTVVSGAAAVGGALVNDTVTAAGSSPLATAWSVGRFVAAAAGGALVGKAVVDAASHQLGLDDFPEKCRMYAATLAGELVGVMDSKRLGSNTLIGERERHLVSALGCWHAEQHPTNNTNQANNQQQQQTTPGRNNIRNTLLSSNATIRIQQAAISHMAQNNDMIANVLETKWHEYKQNRRVHASRIQMLVSSHKLREQLVQFPLVAFHGLTGAGKTTLVEFALGPDRAKKLGIHGGAAYARRTVFPSITWIPEARERGISREICLLDTIGTNTALAIKDEEKRKALEDVIARLNEQLLANCKCEVRFARTNAAATSDQNTLTQLTEILKLTSSKCHAPDDASFNNAAAQLLHPTLSLMTHADRIDNEDPWHIVKNIARDLLVTGDEERIKRLCFAKFTEVQRRLMASGAMVFDTSLKNVAPRRWAVLKPLRDIDDDADECVTLADGQQVRIVDLEPRDLVTEETLQRKLKSENSNSVKDHFLFELQELLREPRPDLDWTGVVLPADVFVWICSTLRKRDDHIDVKCITAQSPPVKERREQQRLRRATVVKAPCSFVWDNCCQCQCLCQCSVQ